MATKLKKGTEVKMINCDEADQNADKVWVCSIDSFFPR